jgi:hypothetical protein
MPKLPIRQASGELRSVSAMWRIYVERVLPRDAAPMQVQECRRAFYAGVQSVLVDGLMGIGDDSVDEDQALNHLTALHDECEQFAEAVKAGRA